MYVNSQSKNIPVIDVSALVKNVPEGKIKVADEIREACTEFGFFYVKHHGIERKLQEDLENLSRQFFSQPVAVKQEICMKKGGRAWRGFFPLGNELTSGKPDMKEGIYFGAELDDKHPLVQSRTPLHGQNLFPNNLPGFKEAVLEYIDEMVKLGHKIMEGIALSLNLKEDYFFSTFFTDDPLPLFRIFNYPALEQEEIISKDSFGVGEHTDYGVLTILKQDNIGGLEVKVKGEWIQAPPIENTFVCNIGDMLDRMTGGLYKSTPHRVRSPFPSTHQDRVSFPFFFDPNFNSRVGLISTLKDIALQIRDDRESRWDRESVHEFDGTYGDYLMNKVSKVFPELRNEVL